MVSNPNMCVQVITGLEYLDVPENTLSALDVDDLRCLLLPPSAIPVIHGHLANFKSKHIVSSEVGEQSLSTLVQYSSGSKVTPSPSSAGDAECSKEDDDYHFTCAHPVQCREWWLNQNEPGSQGEEVCNACKARDLECMWSPSAVDKKHVYQPCTLEKTHCKVEGFPDIHCPREKAPASQSAGVLATITEHVALLEKNADMNEKKKQRMLHRIAN
ncbi:hypothetical protein L210DRAFT_3507610 [Boletus edulis BED1]|uniref:Uncharacterized protein n=1 Tax=Boletus edulis BED1 TaxID=1328754 RepID=A0AAD4BJJ0_BOLED|nr:hypothetical protein L210DRAFT_3507610 [Boletus edulis BED1]